MQKSLCETLDIEEIHHGKEIVLPGDVWQLGIHRLMCGNSNLLVDVNKLLNGLTSVYGLHDPPYGTMVNGVQIIRPDGVMGGDNRKKKDNETNFNWKENSKKYKQLSGDDQVFYPNLVIKMTPDCLLWGANYYCDKLPISKGWIIWDKKGGYDWHDNYSDYEMAWTPFNKAWIYRYLWAGMVREGERVERYHPTQKPIELYVNIINDLFKDPRVIVDLFAGSGTTLLACEELKRPSYNMEIDPYYCNIIIQRYEEKTGDAAKLISGKSRPANIVLTMEKEKVIV
jgi:hypothetical protein